MRLSVKQLDRLCFVCLILLTFFGSYLVVNAGIKQKKQIHQENEDVTQRLKDLDKAENSLQQLDRALKDTRDTLRFIDEKIPPSAEIGLFLKELDAMMKQRNLSLISIQPLSSVKESLFTRIPVRMQFKGLFIRSYQILHDLENMKHAVSLEKLVISKPDTDQECMVDLTASIFER